VHTGISEKAVDLFFLESIYCPLAAAPIPLRIAYLGPGLAHMGFSEGGRGDRGAAEAPGWTSRMFTCKQFVI